ncbi:MAG: class I tRNA ligase family protein, partial [bacterium]|nr:class I tRNA ligase family protein [bacterium]
IEKKLHQTVKKVTEDLDALKFNTAIAAMMEFTNLWSTSFLNQNEAKIFLQILAPFAPHITEELWQYMRNQEMGSVKVDVDSLNSGRLDNLEIKGSKNQHQENPTSHLKNSRFHSIHQSKWPQFDPKLIEENRATIIVQVNGKTRLILEMEKEKGEVQSEVEKLAMESEKIKTNLSGKKAKKIIFVRGELLNIVV